MKLLTTVAIVLCVFAAQADEAKLSDFSASLSSSTISGSVTTGTTLQLVAGCCEMRLVIAPDRFAEQVLQPNRNPISFNHPTREDLAGGTLTLGNSFSGLRFENSRSVIPSDVGVVVNNGALV